MAFVLGRINKGIGGAIGLAWEARAHHKEKKAAAALAASQSQETDREESQTSTTPIADEVTVSPSTSHEEQTDAQTAANQPPGTEIWTELEPDDQDWALDDAAEELTSAQSPSSKNPSEPPPSYDSISTTPPAETEQQQQGQQERPVQEVIASFVASHQDDQPPTTDSSTQQPHIPLPHPVIIPQRRPRQKARGFIRAYAPVLSSSGISQSTFIDFLNALDKSASASPVFTAINIAAMGAGFVPEPIAQGVSAAVQLTVGVASEMQKRSRSNEFLAGMNRELFMPRGLFCMVMTFKPSSRERFVDVGVMQQPQPQDTTTTSSLITKQLSPPTSTSKRVLRQLQVSSGKTRGEFALPDCAELIFPQIDSAAALAAQASSSSSPPISPPQASRLARTSAFLQDYMDRRARASYSYLHPGSRLAVAEEHTWASRYSDPNHPANSGHLVSLLTGGRVNPKPLGQGGVLLGFVWQPLVRGVERKWRERRGEGGGEGVGARGGEGEERGEGDGDPYGEYGRERREGVREAEAMGRGKKGLIGRILTEDVLYLMVCNLPEGTGGMGEGQGQGQEGAATAAAEGRGGRGEETQAGA